MSDKDDKKIPDMPEEHLPEGRPDKQEPGNDSAYSIVRSSGASDFDEGEAAFEENIRTSSHILLFAILAFFAVFLVWASFAQLEEVTRGMGKVIPSSEIQVIQTLEGGIIEEFMVDENDVVLAGQTLIRMSSVEASSDYRANLSRYLGLKATQERLSAEAEGRDELAFSKDVLEGAPQAVKNEREAFTANRRQFAGQLQILQQQSQQKEQQIAAAKSRIRDLERIITLTREERDMVAPMVERGSLAKMELLQLEQRIAETTAELNSLKNSLPELESAVEEMQSRIAGHKLSYQAKARARLADVSLELGSIREKLAALEDRQRRTDVVAPVDGKVKDIKVTTVGGVVQPGEPLLELVPLDDQLLVEARIRPQDIAFLHPGQRATVKVTAYDYSIYGMLEGEVVDISADTLETPQGESFYRVRVRTDQTALEKAGQDLPIIPGMTATVDILTGNKTVMDYLLKPFIKASRSALRER